MTPGYASADQTTGKYKEKNMQVVAVLLGLMVGLVLWSMLATLYHSNPIGLTSVPDLIVIFSPIIGVVLPVALNLLDAKRSVPATWLLALAPVAGLLNVGLCVLIASVTGMPPHPWSLPASLPADATAGFALATCQAWPDGRIGSAQRNSHDAPTS